MSENKRIGKLFSGWLVVLPGLLSGALSATAQAALPLDETTHRISFHQTVPVPGLRPAVLFARGKKWVTDTVGKPQAAGLTQRNTRAATLRMGPFYRTFRVAARSVDDEPMRQRVQLWFTVTVQGQPGGYQYAITELKLQHSGWEDPRPLEAFLAARPTKQLEYETQIVALMYSLERELTTALSTGALPQCPYFESVVY